MRSYGAVLMLLASSVSCSGSKAASRDSVVAQPAVGAVTPSGAPTCQRTGHWSECTVRIRLDQSGLAPQAGSDKVGDLPTLAPKPILLTIGNSGLAYYLFADTASRRAAAASLDKSRFIPQTQSVSMKSETTLIENDNVLLLLFSKNEHQRERVADAITAGPPQP